MPKQNQITEIRSKQKSKYRTEPIVAPVPIDDLTDYVGLSNKRLATLHGNSPQTKLELLTDERLRIAQRRALAGQIGKQGGNQRLQQTIGQNIQTQNSTSIETRRTSRPRKIKIWINSFIPPARINGPPGSEYFLGDNRSFSNDPTASSRTHQEIEFDVETLEESINYKHIGETHEVDRTGNIVFGRGRASRDSLINRSPTRMGRKIIVEFSASAKNPLVRLAPPITINYAKFIIYPNTRTCVLSIQHDGFPAYEAYVTADGGAGVRVYSHNPSQTGEGPLSLYGWGEHETRTAPIRF